MGDLSFLVHPPPSQVGCVQHKVFSPRGAAASGTAVQNPYGASWELRAQLHGEICRTQQLYARLTSQTQMTRTLLEKVPITFMRNVFIEVSAATGFGAKAFTQAELNEVGLSQQNKVAFVEKLSNYVAQALGEPPTPAADTMGDPVLRNRLLQKLHDGAATYKDARTALKSTWHSIGDLEAVLSEAERRGVPADEMTKTRTALSNKKDFQQRAHEGLAEAVRGTSIESLEKTIYAAESHAVPIQDINEAKVVLAHMKAQCALSMAKDGGNIIELEKAVTEGERVNLPKEDLDSAKVILGQMKAQKALTVAIGQTLYSNSISELERAIADAVKNHLPQQEIDKARTVLSQKIEALSTGGVRKKT